MKKLILAVLLVVIFSVGCSGGDKNPVTPQNDLSGLVGEWSIRYDPIVEEDYLTITSTTITSRDAESFSWQYDGVTLAIEAKYIDEFEFEGCVIIGTHLVTAGVPLLPDAISAEFIHSTRLFQTSDCPDWNYETNYTDEGSMRKVGS